MSELMHHKGGSEDLHDVIREAGDLLQQLDGQGGDSEPQSHHRKAVVTRDLVTQNVAPYKNVSKQMLVRLKAIDALASQGYTVTKIWGFIPFLSSPPGIHTSLFLTQAGFSWIAFFFPYAVCAQIREWSYFYVTGFLYFVSSVIYKLSGWDPADVVGLLLLVQYGYFFPYLRWLAAQEERPELSRRNAILLGLLFTGVCRFPASLFKSIFIGE